MYRHMQELREKPGYANVGASWTPQQDLQLRQMARNGTSYSDMARFFQRTENGISQRLRLLSEGGPANAASTARGVDAIVQRVTEAILSQGSSQSLSQRSDTGTPANRMQRWSEADDSDLRRRFGRGEGFDELAAEFGRTKWGVEKRLETLGHLEPQDVYIARIFGPNAEAECPYTGANAPKKMQRWTSDEDATLTSMYNRKRPLSRLCEELERSPYSICCRLEGMGLFEGRLDYARRVLINKPLGKPSAKREREESGDEDEQCDICMDAQKSCAFIPCGHRACKKCAPKVTKCHICRKTVTSTLNLF